MASSSASTTITTASFHSEVVVVAAESSESDHRPTEGILQDHYEGGVSLHDLNQFKNRLRQDILTEFCKYRRRTKTGILLVLKIRFLIVKKVLSQEEWGVPPLRPWPSPALAKKADEEDEEEQGPCPICFAELKPRSECVSLRCNHRFHMDCLRQWMFKSLTCPLCRGECGHS